MVAAQNKGKIVLRVQPPDEPLVWREVKLLEPDTLNDLHGVLRELQQRELELVNSLRRRYEPSLSTGAVRHEQPKVGRNDPWSPES